MGWPLLLDAMNLLEVTAVPLTYLIDEHGVVRYERPTDEDLEVFLAADYPPPSSSAPPRSLSPAPGSAEELTLWGGEEALDDAIVAFERREESPFQSFRLGVAYRERYDSEQRHDGDFSSAVTHWVRALELDPNQYIFRRRIQQYGPRLDKPYSFYDWIHEAREAITARGETPMPLAVEPGGAEFATPVERFAAETDGSDQEEPDRAGRIRRDEKPLIDIETVTVPSSVEPGASVRAHVLMRPDASLKAHWNNEVDELVLWVAAPEGFNVDRRYHRVAVPPEAVSQELRRVEFEIEAPEDFSGTVSVPAYALYYVCEDVNGTCLYRRQDVEVTLRSK